MQTTETNSYTLLIHTGNHGQATEICFWLNDALDQHTTFSIWNSNQVLRAWVVVDWQTNLQKLDQFLVHMTIEHPEIEYLIAQNHRDGTTQIIKAQRTKSDGHIIPNSNSQQAVTFFKSMMFEIKGSSQ